MKIVAAILAAGFALAACVANQDSGLAYAEPRQLEEWYRDDAIAAILLERDANRAEIQLHNGQAYLLAFDDLGEFVNGYLFELDEKFPNRNLRISIK
jgi:nitrous oxide reductase accessory protein NosL